MIKDYYQILELPRTATQQQIAQHYRKLALRFNPKIAKQTSQVNAHVFSHLCEAYEVLSDTLKRAFYDKFGYEKLKEGFYEDGKLIGGYRYADNPYEIFDNFFKNQQTLSAILDLKISTEGTTFGYAFGGQQNTSKFACENLIVKVPCTLEQIYKGATKTAVYDRKVLNSDGRTTSIIHQHKTIHINPGYNSNTVLHFPNEGHQTVHRTVSDLYFQVTELSHPKYQRKGDDLIYTHTLNLADALQCKNVELETLDKRKLNIGVDQIISPRVLREVIGQGLINEKTGKRGNLYIKFNIVFPQVLSQSAKKELRELLS